MLSHFILALLPIIFLIIVLSFLKMPGFKACPVALIIAIVEAIVIWKQNVNGNMANMLGNNSSYICL